MKRMTAWFGGFLIVLSFVLMPSVQATEKPKEWVGSEASFQMNERIQTWLINSLEKMTTAAEKAADFATDELPLFVQEYILFHMVLYWTLISLGLIGILQWFIFWPKIMAWERAGARPETHSSYGKRGTSEGFIPTLYCLLTIVPVGLLISINIKSALMVTFAPRVFLLTEFIKFFK
jgi:hypothetical protein